MLRETIQSLARCPDVQMNSLHDRPQRSLMLNPNTRRTAYRFNVGHHGDAILVPKLTDVTVRDLIVLIALWIIAAGACSLSLHRPYCCLTRIGWRARMNPGARRLILTESQ